MTKKLDEILKGPKVPDPVEPKPLETWRSAPGARDS